MKGYALKKWESTLNLCVYAHGPDVELIMEAARKNNYFLGTSSSCIHEFILCNRGSDHIFSLIPFLGQVEVLFLCRSLHLSNLYFDLPSSITLWYLENIMELQNFLWVHHQLLFLTASNFPGFWVVVNREHRFVKSNQHCDSVLPVLCC